MIVRIFGPVCLAALVAATSISQSVAGADDGPAFDTQDVGTGLTPPDEALRGIQLPSGFHATLFAAEPDVRQPIAMTTDERGRLWVAENYTYAESTLNFQTKFRDRIVILEDSDGDGRFDDRRVFWDQGSKLTSIEIGLGGVWALCAPQLLFIPDRDRDDVPDGEPIVVLDGWDAGSVRHNIVNGLRWGPDGWLYGRHGILAVSYVGVPGASREERTPIDCGIWRYHPTRKTFQVVARGTTNSWGMDWDEHGQFFFINTVIGHLWHVVPGAYYERMYGEHANPHLYKLIPQTADHFHWDTAEAWHDIRRIGVSPTTDQAGGGHAHCGMMIYLGDNWPDEHRNRVFTVNLHGRRLNQDRLERSGAGYVGRHEPDFGAFADPWFRGIELLYGPDGGVFVADWSDTGECHENDGVHRSSGRVYKITHDGAKRADRSAFPKDLASCSDNQLVELQRDKNHWHARQARRLLQERAIAGKLTDGARQTLRAMFTNDQEVTNRLAALWSLHVTSSVGESWLRQRLADPNEHVRAWAIQLLLDPGTPSEETQDSLVRLAQGENSGLVLSYLASALGSLPIERRLTLGSAIADHARFADDPRLPLLVWYGIEPAVPRDAQRALDIVARTESSVLRQHTARRITAEIEHQPEAAARLVETIGRLPSASRRDVLVGMTAALQGWRRAPAPAGWDQAAKRLAADADEIRDLARELSVVFGDGRAMDELRATIAEASADPATRRAAIRALVSVRADGIAPLLEKLLADRDLAADAARGLAVYDRPETPDLLIAALPKMRTAAQVDAVDVLVSRPAYAKRLLDAIAESKIDRQFVSAFQLRQLGTLGDAGIDGAIQRLWPDLQQQAVDKKERIERLRGELTTDALADADPSAGRVLFQRACAGCHKLFGAGETVGPDLTGAQRSNLNYLLENILDPSATVSKNFHLSVLVLTDGRIVNGIIGQETERTITLRTPQQQLVIARDEIDEIRPSNLSLMPERILDVFSADEVRHLIRYLMSPQQVPLAE